jgi:hypothetical protein
MAARLRSPTPSSDKSYRKPSKLVHAITNPSFGRLFEYKEPDPNAKKIEDSRVAAFFGAPKLDISRGSTNAALLSPPLFTPPIDPEEPLFSPELVSVDIESTLPEGYRLRPLEQADYHKGFMMVQSCLGTVGQMSESKWNERIQFLKTQRGTQYVICMVDGQGTVVCTGSLLIERKL